MAGMTQPADPRPHSSPRVLLVTRHAGAEQWLRQQLQAPDADVVAHLADPALLARGDIVAGNLPLALAAALCARGVVVLGIDLPLQPQQRGLELDADAMRAAGAGLRRYRVRAEAWGAGLHQAAADSNHERLPAAGTATGREE